MTDDWSEPTPAEPMPPAPGSAAFGGNGITDLGGRLGAVSVEETDDVAADTQAAAIAALDLGIRLLGETDDDAGAAAAARAVIGRPVAGLTATPITSSPLLSRDNRARQAFILGGPAAVAALPSD